jgi:hypothetical protein
MITQTWIDLQVNSLPLAELKKKLGVSRLVMNRSEISKLLGTMLEHQKTLLNLKATHSQGDFGVKYPGFMKRLARSARLATWLFNCHIKENVPASSSEHSIDSSLLPVKREANIRQKDWDAGRVTTRKKDGKTTHTCGEKALVVVDENSRITHQSLMVSINDSDMNVLKAPMWVANQGIRKGLLLADRGFSCKAVRDRILAFVLLKDLVFLSPWPKKSKTQLTDDEWETYAARWKVEEVFRQLKDIHQPYRLILTGLRKRVFHVARLAFACLLWNEAKCMA